MLVLACEIHHLRHLGLGNFIGEHAALPDPMMMDVEHDLGRRFRILLEKLLKHVNNELHRRVIVVQNQDPVKVFGLTLVMTDVAGPPVPALRFSSLLIRRAEAAVVADAVE
jgi:hypothetical protein